MKVSELRDQLATLIEGLDDDDEVEFFVDCDRDEYTVYTVWEGETQAAIHVDTEEG